MTRATGDSGDQGEQADPDPDYDEPSNSASAVDAPQESRSLYCSTNGVGVALNLLDAQGAHMVELGS